MQSPSVSREAGRTALLFCLVIGLDLGSAARLHAVAQDAPPESGQGQTQPPPPPAPKPSAGKQSPRAARSKAAPPPESAKNPSEKPDSPQNSPADTQTDPASPADSNTLRFSRDIAPILVANCVGCHNGQRKDNAFNLTTYQNLLKGTPEGPVIVPGKPQESRLVELVQTREMPRGNNRRLSDEAIARITRWVDEGATLDPGASPTATLASIAPSEAELRRMQAARLSTSERDQKTQDAGLERWKKSAAPDEPDITSSRAFLIFSKIPRKRAEALARALDSQRGLLAQILGPSHPAFQDPAAKISVFLFNDRAQYVEFVRTLENREIDADHFAHAKLDDDFPYLAAIDPLAGADESPASQRPKAASRKKNAPLDPASPSLADRSLPGLLAEQLASGFAARAPKAPRWLTSGLGAYFAAQVEPRSPYVRNLRAEAIEHHRVGWQTRSSEGLGPSAPIEQTRAIGFALCEFIASAARPQFPAFLQAVSNQGGEKLYEIVKQGFDLDTDAFYQTWGNWVAQNYRAYARPR
jgi:mono/diheme cytochrome c family protein